MAKNWRNKLLERQPWITFVAPMVVYMIFGSLEPTPEAPGGGSVGLAIPYSHYPLLYAAKIALTMAAMVFVLPGYARFPLRVGWLAVVLGIIGGALWIGICKLDVEHVWLQPVLKHCGMGWIVGSGDRPAFNPFEQLAGQPGWIWSFLAVRFLGLVAVVPVVEEFFLRGFLMRFVMERDWWEIQFGKANAAAIAIGTAVPMLTHTGELLAAMVWFSMITWLMLRTRNIWDCVAAHAITNLLLGVYVVVNGGVAWRLL